MIEITNENFKNTEYNQKGPEHYILYLHQSPSNKYYVGITCQGVERRWRIDGSGYYQCKYFYSAIQKYGWGNFKHYIIRESMNKEDAEQAEINLIKHLREDGYSLYNISNGGNASFAGIPLSEDHKRKISESNMGRPPTKMSEDGKQRLVNSLKGNKNALGYQHTEETKERISKILTGRKRAPFTEEHLKHLSESKKGKPLSNAQKIQLEKLHKSNIGRKMSDNARKALIKRNTGRIVSEETRRKMSKPVIQYDIKMNFIAEYPSITEASKKTNCNMSSISACCNGKQKTCGGFIWKRKEIKEIDYNDEKYDVA